MRKPYIYELWRHSNISKQLHRIGNHSKPCYNIQITLITSPRTKRKDLWCYPRRLKNDTKEKIAERDLKCKRIPELWGCRNPWFLSSVQPAALSSEWEGIDRAGNQNKKMIRRKREQERSMAALMEIWHPSFIESLKLTNMTKTGVKLSTPFFY